MREDLEEELVGKGDGCGSLSNFLCCKKSVKYMRARQTHGTYILHLRWGLIDIIALRSDLFCD